MLSEPVNLFAFKLRTYAFVIVFFFCFFVIIKSIMMLGGIREFIKIIFEEIPKEDL